ncbi:ABC transporter ATP-binding protein [bacterium]|nr:ABC transporter ATP-binding protein [bacterium]
MDFLIQASNLSKKFGKADIALDDLSMVLKKGEVLGLLGPNGAGKTTAMHIFLGILTPTAGQVEVLGMSPFKERHRISQRINFSSAYVSLPSNLKVYESLTIFAGLYGVHKKQQKIDELLSLFEIEYLAKRLNGALSAGEKTRVNLCKCFLNDPEILLLDEPTASLDPDMADKVRQIIKKIQNEKRVSMIYTSHNMAEIDEVCDRIIFINHGRKIAEGTSDEIVKAHGCSTLDEVFIKLVRHS